mmetsp:Transcript_49632/g.130972  ORF Transcript_49632/g.130972 Transcript_49632/m.130972 type:complete len:992 (-) Transcript_49632:8-2983(-)
MEGGFACCGLDSVRLATKLQNRLCDNAVDEIARSKPRAATANRKKFTSTEESSKAEAQGARAEEMEFGLPSIEQDYDYDPNVDLSTGFGVGLKRYVHKKTRMPRAVLSIPKACIPASLTAAAVQRQLELLCKIDHPNIVPFRECCEDSRRLRLVYDWCSGGLFLSQLAKYEGMLTEGHVAQVIRELLSALAAAHSFGVHHLDLGLFSLFVQYTDRLSPIKLFGIGLAGFIMPPVTLRRFSKSNKHYYASPELFMQSDVAGMGSAMRHACDIWSVGAILYTLCSGGPPFGAGSIREVAHRVQKARLEFGVEFDEYSLNLKDILEQLMMVPWIRRPSATTMLKHPWVTNTRTLQLKDGKINQLAMTQLNTFAHQDHVKQTVARLLTDIGLTIKAYKGLEKMFAEMDLNADGTITLGELVEITSKMPGISEKQVENIIKKLDRNGNCNVDISEFVAALVMEQEELDERLIKKAFAKMDKNGDARVNKRELFTVLRQYSGTLETKQVSTFVGRTDDDGDQKIDYREFCGLFPQVRDKYDEIDRRMALAKAGIQLGPRYLERFKETIKTWLEKLTQHRDKMEIACGLRHLPDHIAAGTAYSYERGHLTEFDVQAMIKDIITHLQHPPGRHMTKAQKKARHDRRRAREEVGRGGRQMMGLTILSTSATSKGLGDQTMALRRANSGDQSGSGESGSEGEQQRKMLRGAESAVQHWASVVAQDRREKAQDAEFREEAYLLDYLYWLIKVKSDYQWQVPLMQAIDACRNSCVEEIIEVIAESKQELAMLQGCMDEKYVIREDYRFRDTKLPVNAHLLPMGSFAGKSLKSSVWWEKIETLRVPASFFFGWAKHDVTQQKIEFMKEVHMAQLEWVGKYCTGLLQSIDNFLEECSEDLAISGTLESLMPNPPPLSHLYLKHCEGRELAQDAVTPRSDDLAASDEEDVVAQGDDAVISAATGAEPANGATLTGSRMGERRKRLERNAVLNQARPQGSVVKQGAR